MPTAITVACGCPKCGPCALTRHDALRPRPPEGPALGHLRGSLRYAVDFFFCEGHNPKDGKRS